MSEGWTAGRPGSRGPRGWGAGAKPSPAVPGAGPQLPATSVLHSQEKGSSACNRKGLDWINSREEYWPSAHYARGPGGHSRKEQRWNAVASRAPLLPRQGRRPWRTGEGEGTLGVADRGAAPQSPPSRPETRRGTAVTREDTSAHWTCKGRRGSLQRLSALWGPQEGDSRRAGCPTTRVPGLVWESATPVPECHDHRGPLLRDHVTEGRGGQKGGDAGEEGTAKHSPGRRSPRSGAEKCWRCRPHDPGLLGGLRK